MRQQNTKGYITEKRIITLSVKTFKSRVGTSSNIDLHSGYQ